ncbi:unnamed protein product, partial [Amoebophrya sp. A25]
KKFGHDETISKDAVETGDTLSDREGYDRTHAPEGQRHSTRRSLSPAISDGKGRSLVEESTFVGVEATATGQVFIPPTPTSGARSSDQQKKTVVEPADVEPVVVQLQEKENHHQQEQRGQGRTQ